MFFFEFDSALTLFDASNDGYRFSLKQVFGSTITIVPYALN